MSGDLQLNKIFGAGLATVLVIMGAKIGSDVLFAVKPVDKPGYAIEVAEEGGEGGGADAAAADMLPDWGTVLASADLAAGEAVFKKCTSCHKVEKGGANGTGPGLWGVVGGPIAKHAGFTYSEALTAHGAAAGSWSYDELYGFLKAPNKHVKGTKMAFAGLKKGDERVNLIAWLRTQSDAPAAIPAADPSRQPGAAAPAVEAPAAAAPADATAAPAAPAEVAAPAA